MNNKDIKLEIKYDLKEFKEPFRKLIEMSETSIKEISKQLQKALVSFSNIPASSVKEQNDNLFSLPNLNDEFKTLDQNNNTHSSLYQTIINSFGYPKPFWKKEKYVFNTLTRKLIKFEKSEISFFTQRSFFYNFLRINNDFFYQKLRKKPKKRILTRKISLYLLSIQKRKA